MAKKLFDELTTVKNHSISDFLFDEEASIPEGRLFAIGSLIIVLTCTLGVHEAIAWHTSHSSHSSHGSGGGYGHFSHTSGSMHSVIATTFSVHIKVFLNDMGGK